MIRTCAIVTLVIALGAPASAETVTIEASRDATLIEHPDGALANGSGPFLFVGRTSQAANANRRALLHFDVAGAIPRRAIIENVELTLVLAPSNPEPRDLRLHRVLADWGEGPSSTSGGKGVPSEPNDVTWLHAFYDTEFWAHSGGQFTGTASAGLEVGDVGFYTWTSTPRLIANVRLWTRVPQRNYGWILIGDETEPTTAKSFASREFSDPAVRPVLRVTYRLPGRR